MVNGAVAVLGGEHQNSLVIQTCILKSIHLHSYKQARLKLPS